MTNKTEGSDLTLNKQREPLMSLLQAQKQAFLSHPFPSERERVANLDRLMDAVLARKEEFIETLNQDFGGRARVESLLNDVFIVVAAIKHAKRELRKWMKPRKRDVPFILGLGRAWVMPQPLGVIGIVAPWNFPLNLSLSPLAAALAAGNRAMIKPSEHTPATSELLRLMISEAFSADHVVVVTGDASVGQQFVSLPFDHLLFTGSTEVGRQVMKAAAENLTPVTLELGGKSPAIVAPDADLQGAALDIAFGKGQNAGQICIAPDYALISQEQMVPFVKAVQQAFTKYYPAGFENTPDYTAVVNERHLQRLRGYVEEAKQRGAEVVPLGAAGTVSGGAATRKMQPVAIIDPPEDLAVMREEIFGPVLIVKPYQRLEDAIRYVNSHPRPLALYIFAKSSELVKHILTHTIAGGVSINDTLMHCVVEDLPFGGVGPSGIGHYHGQEGFDTFSKLKPVFERNGPRADRMLRPPFKQFHEMLIRLLIAK